MPLPPSPAAPAGPAPLPIASLVLGALLVVLVVAGGASRADAPGQAPVRIAAFLALAAGALVAAPVERRTLRAPAILLAAIAALPALQLVPLPPALWQALPGRAPATAADAILGGGARWRPLSLTPAATLNAFLSLIVPLAVGGLAATLPPAARRWLPGAVLTIAGVAMLVALVQVSGNRFEQPLIGYTYQVSGVFANRNHFAIMMAIGCLVAPVWAVAGRPDGSGWRGPVAAGLVLMFVLSTLASGSRAGMAAAVIALVVGPLVVRHDLARMLHGYPRWVAPVMIAILVLMFVAAIGASVSNQRAVSVDRLIAADIGEDMRSRALPSVLTILATYFPVGAGFGSFDAVFRIVEPFALLKPTYFNQAHDDIVGVVIDGGLPAAAILLAAAAWWARATWTVWRRRGAVLPEAAVGRLGSAIIAFVFLASIVDYPARVPVVMAVLALAALWLAWGAAAVRGAVRLPAAPGPV